MPGLNVVYNLKGPLDDRGPVLDRALKACCVGDDYRAEHLHDGSALVITAARYAEYPLRSFENDRFRVFLEGRIYGLADDAMQRQVLTLADVLFGQESSRDQTLRDWLTSTDGEFVAVVLEKATGRLVCFNDIFCRLPLYLSYENNVLVLTRNIRFAVDMLPVKRLDRMAVAQFCLFDFAMGCRTFFEGLERVAGASLIEVEPDGGRLERRVVYTFNFEQKAHADKSIEENGQRIAALFRKACRDRVPEGYKAVVSLSGGMDSRVVAGALRAEGVDVVAVSWVDFRGAARADAEIARRVARALDIPWSLGQLRRAEGRDLFRTLQIKLGQCFLGSAHLLQHLDRVRNHYGPKIIYMPGNSGDRLNHDLRPHRAIGDLDELVEHILHHERRLSGRGDLPLEDIAAITRLSAEEIKNEIKRELAEYPEQTMEQKFVHFIHYGQSIKRHLEGDDRNRTYVWSASPFWSVPLFLYMVNCPDEQKREARLYMAYVEHIDPRLARIRRVINQNPNPCWIGDQAPWCSRLASVTATSAQRLWGRIKKVYKPIRWRLFGRRVPNRDFSHSPDLLRCMEEQIDACGAIAENLSVPALQQVLGNSQRYNASSMAILLTITSMIEYVYDGRSRLMDYAEANLASYV